MPLSHCIHTHSDTIDAKITGRALLSLTESRLERSGVSLGFQCTLMNVIENLVCDIQISGYVNLK